MVLCHTQKLYRQSRAKCRHIFSIRKGMHVRRSEPYRDGQLQLQLPWTPRCACARALTHRTWQ